MFSSALVCLFVSLLAGLGKDYATNFYKTQWKGGVEATEENTMYRGRVMVGLGAAERCPATGSA